MSSICWPRTGVKEKSKRDLRRSFYGGLAFVAIWTVNVAVILVGWPFLVYGRLKWKS